jgi:DNA primase (EC 2.7.7.-)
MGERIPEEIIEEIRRSADIVDVVSDYVQLKKSGRNYFGLCPFHGEKTPSFSVSREKQIYHCFGCGAGGNVFSFLMEIEGIPFQEAVRRLASKAGIELPVFPGQQGARWKSSEPLREAHRWLDKFYHHLLVHTREGQEALEYLHQRGFTDEVIEHFRIGYAPGGDAAYRLLKGKGFPEKVLVDSGLIIRRETGDYIDRFRERIMFPIKDLNGDTVAFSGRVFKGGEPKYLNSPETPIFQKGKILYNFHEAKAAIRKKQKVILFEGFADCIAAYRAGIDNGVATMGTALSEEHVRLLRRNTEKVVLCFDADEAGLHAAWSAGELLTASGCDVEVAVVPEGKDPDEYIQTFGPEKFRSGVLENAWPFMTFKMHRLRTGKNFEREGDRLDYIESVVREIARLEKPIERDFYLRKLAEEFSLSLEALKQQAGKVAARQRREEERGRRKTEILLRRADQKPRPAYFNAERILLALMLKNIQLAYRIRDQLGDYAFNVDEHQAIFTYLLAFYEGGNPPDISRFFDFLPDSGLKKAVAEIGMISLPDGWTEKELDDCIRQVLKFQMLKKIKEKEQEGKRAEREGDYLKAAQIAREIIELRKTL